MFRGLFLAVAVVVVAAAATANARTVPRRDILFAELWLDRPFADPVATIYAGPSPASRPLGTLVLVSRADPDQRLRTGVDFRPVTGPQIAWLYDVGDRRRAVSVFVLAQRGRWIQLPEDPFPAAAWLELDAGGFGGEVPPVIGRVFGIAGGIRAVDVATGRAAILSDDRNFVLERISGNDVVVRVERSEERYSVPIGRLFDRAGRPLLWPVKE